MAVTRSDRGTKRAERGGLKNFQTADFVICGVELAEKIKKGQFKLGKLSGRGATPPEIWRATLAA